MSYSDGCKQGDAETSIVREEGEIAAARWTLGSTIDNTVRPYCIIYGST